VALYSPSNIATNTPGPYTPDYTFNAIATTKGISIAQFPASLEGTSYWISLEHRNHISTWSANPVTLQEYTTYDFSNASNKAYGSNMKEVSTGVWASFSGDINQDENVDLLDLSILDSSISNFDFGYVSTDINGDSNVDLLDNPIIEGNINQFIFSVHP
jgi:hypothetical protein